MKNLILKFDRYVLKRYFGIETPAYKTWWCKHAEETQQKLNQHRAYRDALGKGYIYVTHLK